MVKAISAGRQTAAKADVNDAGGSFQQTLRAALIERGIVNRLGDPNYPAFSELLDGYKYEALRKAIVGDRPPSPGLMEACAAALEQNPEMFLEYRVWQAKRMFDPREVGMAEAIKNLDAWAKAQGR